MRQRERSAVQLWRATTACSFRDRTGVSNVDISPGHVQPVVTAALPTGQRAADGSDHADGGVSMDETTDAVAVVKRAPGRFFVDHD